MNPILDQPNAQVDKVQSKDDLWKLVSKILLGALGVAIAAIAYMYTEIKEQTERHGIVVKEMEVKQGNLEAWIRDHLESDNEYLRKLDEQAKHRQQ